MWCQRPVPRSRALKPITRRPLLLAVVGKVVNHANQTTLYLTPLHGTAQPLETLIANISAALQHVRQAAQQLTQADRWVLLLRYVSDRIAPTLGPFKPRDGLPASG